ncbi:MAG: hypothetical protein ACPHK8_06750 [Thermoplasmatota archaeon]
MKGAYTGAERKRTGGGDVAHGGSWQVGGAETAVVPRRGGPHG